MFHEPLPNKLNITTLDKYHAVQSTDSEDMFQRMPIGCVIPTSLKLQLWYYNMQY